MNLNSINCDTTFRQTLLAACLLFLSGFAHSNNDIAAALQSIPDSQLKLCLQQAQTKHQWSSISDVLKIKCHSKKITLIDGLEQFSSLTELSLFNNDIENFQLPNLPRLLKLNIAKNPISVLKLSHNKLQVLLVFSANIDTLDLNLPAATMIRANNNHLTAFNYRQLGKLNKLYLFNNKLPTLEMKGLTALHFLDVRQNPMPDALYDQMDQQLNITIFHDGNADDWE